MSKGNNINDFLGMMGNAGKAHVKVQTAWAKVKKVNWDEKLMDVEGVADGLDFNDVLLGLGNVYRKPKVGSLCLIGLVQNNDAAAFLIDCEVVEEMEIETSVKVKLKSVETVFNEGNNGGLVILSKLESNLKSIKDFIEGIHSSLPAAFTAIGVAAAANGATGATSYSAAMAGKIIQTANMENTKVKH